MNFYGQTARDFQECSVCVPTTFLATAGQFVRVVGATTVEGLRVLQVAPALATSPEVGKGTIGLFQKAVSGAGTAAAGVPVVVQWSGDFVSTGSGGSAGAPLFVDDFGFPSHVPGTFRRSIGTIHGYSGPMLGLLFGELNGRAERLSDDAMGFEEDLGTAGTARNVRLFYGLRVSTNDLAIAGGVSVPISCDAVTYLVTCSGGAGAITVQLPLAPVDGTDVTIKDANGGAAINNVVLDASGKTIDGAATLTLSTNWASVTLRYARSKWYVIAKVV